MDRKEDETKARIEGAGGIFDGAERAKGIVNGFVIGFLEAKGDQQLTHGCGYFFRKDYDYVFEWTAETDAEINRQIGAAVVSFFPDADRTEIPASVKQAVSKEIQVLKQILNSKAGIEKFIVRTNERDQLQELRSRPDFDEVRETFLSEKTPEILESLNRCSWDRVSIDGDMLSFVGGFDFEKKDGNWRLFIR